MRAAFPKKIHPELATTGTCPEGGDWLFETKFDGYRICSFIKKNKIQLISRNQKNWTDKFAEIAASLNTLPVKTAIFDGEIVALDDTGVSRFQLLQNAFELNQTISLYYFIFDCLFLNGKNLMSLPLLERKKILAELISNWQGKPDNIRLSEYVIGDGKWIWQQACQHGLEGLIAKRCNSLYLETRSDDWIKCKCLRNQEFVIGGYTAPSGTRHYFGALLLGYYCENKFIYCGLVGTGFDEAMLKHLYSLLTKMTIDHSPFENPPQEKYISWVKPELVCEVNFLEWTTEGLLRQASFQGLRRDKPAKEVTVEIDSTHVDLRPESNLEVAGIIITHPDKILYPESIIRKKEVVKYYEKIADKLLPHIIERPLTLVRCPEGIQQACFFQRHFEKNFPQIIYSIDTPEGHAFFYIKDLAGLIALIQLGALEIHPWGSTIHNLQTPDRIIFDLDPGETVEWDEVVSAAQLIREILNDVNLISFAKLTGGKGIHVVVPLAPKHSWKDITEFSKTVALYLSQEKPKQFTATMKKNKREGKIFIDYLRNAMGATAIAPYSTRARLHAPIAAPVSWQQLAKLSAGNHFTLEHFTHSDYSKDVWKDFFEIKQKLPG